MIVSRKKSIIVFCIVFLCLALLSFLLQYLRNTTVSANTAVNSSEYRTLVIDAGHGGPDGGAIGITGTVEKNINLSIALRCELLMELAGVNTVMTRREDISLHGDESLSIGQKKVADIRKRVDIVKSINSPVLLSIHMNSFPQSKYSGAQVFYSKTNAQSQIFAEVLQDSLRNGVNPDNARVAKQVPNEVYLMKNVECPAVIVECGFLSNREEEALLQTENHQKKIAMSIGAATINFLYGETDMTNN